MVRSPGVTKPVNPDKTAPALSVVMEPVVPNLVKVPLPVRVPFKVILLEPLTPTLGSAPKGKEQVLLTVLVPEKNKDLFYNNKYIDNIILIDLDLFNLLKTIIKNYNKFDVVIDMEHWLNISSIIAFFCGRRRIGFSNKKIRALLYNDKVRFNEKEHSVINNALLLGPLNVKIKDIGKLEKIEVSEEKKKFVENFLKNNKINKNDFLVGITPGSGATVRERRWPKERFVEIVDYLIEKYNAKIVFIGSKDEKDLIEEIQKLTKNHSINNIGFNLGQTIALINKCKLFVSNDTGPMHIAAAQGIKTIGLFGPETPVIFGPYGKQNIGLFKKVKCSPCIRVYEGRYTYCDNSNICMKEISVGEVKEAVDGILK